GRRSAARVCQGDPAGRAALHLNRPAARPGAGVAHPGRDRDARVGAVGTGLADLWRARIPQHRRDAIRDRDDCGHRPRAGEAGLPTARAVHGRALGDDDVTIHRERMRSILRSALSLVAVAAIYEGVARSGHLPTVLLPTLPTIAEALWTALVDGT